MVFLASDNTSAVAPEIMQALMQMNSGHAKAYGADDLSAELTLALRACFEHDTLEAFPVFNGSASNCTALAALVRPFEAVIGYAESHIQNDECGMPEFFTGGKVLTVGGDAGKLDFEAVRALLARATGSGVHHTRPIAISIAELTEAGTVYEPSEVRALSALAKANGLYLHMDGARFANAVAHLGCSPAELTWKSGIDVLSFGATKNGAMMAEVVVFFRSDLAANFGHIRKRAGQLASKQRYISAQLLAYLKDDLWLKNATHANEMAQRLDQGLVALPSLRRLYPVQGNMLFLTMPADVAEHLMAQGHYFYGWGGTTYRLVTSFSTTPEEIEAFLKDCTAAQAS